MQALEARVVELTEPTLADMGYELVRVLVMGKQSKTVQVMAERVDRVPMTVDDCAEISRAISAVLDVHDPIAGAYTLEVSSPGLDRPLTKPEHFERFAGFVTRLETDLPRDGQRRFKGELLGLRGDDVVLRVDGNDVAIPRDRVRKAKLVLTDALLAAHQQQH